MDHVLESDRFLVLVHGVILWYILWRSGATMRKDEMEKIVEQFKIDKLVSARVRYHCIAFWSVATACSGIIGAWVASNSGPIAVGFTAFLEALSK